MNPPTKFIQDEFYINNDTSDVLKLDGNYIIELYKNDEVAEKVENGSLDLAADEVVELHCKNIFVDGNVLYNADVEKIKDYLKITTDILWKGPGGLNYKKISHAGGTICPSEIMIQLPDGRQVHIYGRYIYGFSPFGYINFHSKNKINTNAIVVGVEEEEVEEDDGDEDFEDVSEEEEDEEEEEEKVDIIGQELITLTGKEIHMADHYYSFKIVNTESGVLEAFCLYG